jgi:hypothetical protein
MSILKLHLGAAAVMVAVLALPGFAHAHGIAGDRFFPATILTDDPFAADELALPTIGAGNHAESYDFEWSKTLFPRFAVSIEGGYVDDHPPGGPNSSGFDNFEITPTWQFLTLGEDELVASAAFGVEIGGSGSPAVTDKFTTYTPKLLVGKGFGDLPDSMALLRPLALTAVVGYAIPGTSSESDVLKWGGALEYSLRYLNSDVEGNSVGSFAAQFTPVVEFSFETPTDAGGTTGTINPGLLWSGTYIQLGVEASIPLNSASGENVGVLAQLHFYMDDMFPLTLGRPLFGRSP